MMYPTTGFTPTIPNPLRDFDQQRRHYYDMRALGFDDCECNECRDYLATLEAAYTWNAAIDRERKPTPPICDHRGRIKGAPKEPRMSDKEHTAHLGRYGY